MDSADLAIRKRVSASAETDTNWQTLLSFVGSTSPHAVLIKTSRLREGNSDQSRKADYLTPSKKDREREREREGGGERKNEYKEDSLLGSAVNGIFPCRLPAIKPPPPSYVLVVPHPLLVRKLRRQDPARNIRISPRTKETKNREKFPRRHVGARSRIYPRLKA